MAQVNSHVIHSLYEPSRLESNYNEHTLENTAVEIKNHHRRAIPSHPDPFTDAIDSDLLMNDGFQDQQPTTTTTTTANVNAEFLGTVQQRNQGPIFDPSTPKNVTALVGKSAYLNCRVRNLANKTVCTS